LPPEFNCLWDNDLPLIQDIGKDKQNYSISIRHEGAFENEVILLEDKLTDADEQTIERVRFASGTLCGQRVVVAWTGVGKINAAMTTTLLIEHSKPSRIIFTGIAGGANPQLHPGYIVIAEKTAYHDMGTLWPDGLYRRGVKNRLTGWENPVFFPADERQS
jgi:adenosylhomocysteine nucleosidase